MSAITDKFKVGHILKEKVNLLNKNRVVITDIDPIYDDYYGMVMHYNYTLVGIGTKFKSIIKDEYVEKLYIIDGFNEAVDILFGGSNLLAECQLLERDRMIMMIHDEITIDLTGTKYASCSVEERILCLKKAYRS